MNSSPGKRKRKSGFDSNLKRFKSDVRRLQSADENDGTVQPYVKTVKNTTGLTRKERRKEERKLKKMRRNAFKKHLPVSLVSCS